MYPFFRGQSLRVRLVAVPKGKYRFSIFNQQAQQILTQMAFHDGADKDLLLLFSVSLPVGIYSVLLIDAHKFFKQNFWVQ